MLPQAQAAAGSQESMPSVEEARDQGERGFHLIVAQRKTGPFAEFLCSARPEDEGRSYGRWATRHDLEYAGMLEHRVENVDVYVITRF